MLESKSISRIPRGLVLVNGVQLPWVSFTVTYRAYNSSSTFELSLAVKQLPKEYNEKYFSDEAAIVIDIYAGFPQNPDNFNKEQLKLLISGQLDQMEYEPAAGVIQLWGRDLSGQLLDTKTTETYQNRTASDIAIAIAKKHNLTPVVTATKTKIGTYLNNNYTSINRERSEWDLLSALADQENFIVYVQGTELHFEPQPDEQQKNYYTLQYTQPGNSLGSSSLNAINIDLQKNYSLSRTVTVTVRSSGVNGTVSGTVRRTSKRDNKISPRAKLIGDEQKYEKVIPGLSKQQCLETAQKLAKRYSQEERRIRVEAPAVDDVSINKLIQLKGTNTSFDQVYYPESISLKMNLSDGYLMILDAKNHSPQNELIV